MDDFLLDKFSLHSERHIDVRLFLNVFTKLCRRRNLIHGSEVSLGPFPFVTRVNLYVQERKNNTLDERKLQWRT